MAHKRYRGRLGFNPDTLFHHEMLPDEAGNLAALGKRVVTDDAGKSWRYATDADTSHNERHHQRAAVVTGTVDEKLPGHEHHLFPLLTDPHHAPGATNDAGVLTHTRVVHLPDEVAATVSGHTDAWKETA